MIPVELDPPIGTKTSPGSTAADLSSVPEVPWQPEPFPETERLYLDEAAPAASYRLGPPARPPITHDNGYRQNPADAGDPAPTATVAPSAADLLARAKWRVILEGSDFLRSDLADANAAYRHFLEGSGGDRTIDYERFLRDDPSGRTVLTESIRDAQLAAQSLYAKAIAEHPELADRPVVFSFSGGEIRIGDPASGDRFPYPETENWQKALGGHSLWISGRVTVEPTPAGPRFSMAVTLHAEDRYNFNPGDSDIATDAPDSVNGRFEETGLARQYTNHGTAERTVVWIPSPGGSEGTSTRSGPSRNRPPPENRNPRSRC